MPERVLPFRSRALAQGWALLILVLTLLPPPEVPGAGWLSRYHLDKVVHAGLFAVLCVLLVQALDDARGHVWRPYRSTILGFVLSVLYGGLTELLQGTATIGRSADIWDLVADAAGALLGTVYFRRASARYSHQGDR